MTAYVNDPDYYFDDGDCVIRVEDTLFCVHKSFLRRDSSMFFDMFSMSQKSDAGSPPTGGTREMPIVLTGDTPRAMRALLWILYALPLEIATMESAKELAFDVLSRLWSLVLIANKYGFATVEIWSFNLLVKHCTKEEENYMTQCSETDMRLLLEVCSLNPKKLLMTDSAGLLVKVKEALQKRAKDKEHQHPIDIAQALNVAGEYKLRDLQGLLYYDVLQQAALDAFKAQQDLEYSAFLPPGLSDDHHQAVFRRGFAYLSLTSERIFRDAWDELGQCPCGPNSTCSDSARVTVKASLGQCRADYLSIDVLGMFAQAKQRDTLSRQPGWSGVAAGDCEERLTRAIAARESQLRAQLGTIFLGSEESN